jgi:hypothetical protein
MTPRDRWIAMFGDKGLPPAKTRQFKAGQEGFRRHKENPNKPFTLSFKEWNEGYDSAGMEFWRMTNDDF